MAAVIAVGQFEQDVRMDQIFAGGLGMGVGAGPQAERQHRGWNQLRQPGQLHEPLYHPRGFDVNRRLPFTEARLHLRGGSFRGFCPRFSPGRKSGQIRMENREFSRTLTNEYG
jgi:hypothetical protein